MHAHSTQLESRYAWLRLAASVALSAIGGVGMWSVVVALPAMQADFGVDRAAAALPYTLAMLGFAGGGGWGGSLWQVALAHGLLIGFGCSATFGPLMADISHWFSRRRGIAVALAGSGNYIGGTVWPPVVQHFISSNGWRAPQLGIR